MISLLKLSKKFLIYIKSKFKNILDYLLLYCYIFRNNLRKDIRIFTHMTIAERVLIHRVLTSFDRDIVYLEIGSYLGASSVIAANATKLGSKIYCIDTWGNHAMSYIPDDIDSDERDTFSHFMSNIGKYKNKIIPIRGWSYEVKEEFLKHSQIIDFLFIDGDHNYQGVKKDWELYSNLVSSGGYIAFHDTGWSEGVQRLIAENLTEPSFTLYKKLPNLKVFKVSQ